MKGRRRSHYLELAKQGRGKTKAQHNRKFQENGVNRKLEKSGRGRWSRILSRRSLGKACNENKGEEEESLSWFRKMGCRKWVWTWVRNEGEEELKSMGSCGPHYAQNLRRLKHRLTGPGWKRRRRQNRSPKNLVSKKYKFDIVLRFRNLVQIWCEMTELPFWPKIWVSGLQTQTGWKRKLNNKIKPFKINQNHNIIEKSRIPPKLMPTLKAPLSVAK